MEGDGNWPVNASWEVQQAEPPQPISPMHEVDCRIPPVLDVRVANSSPVATVSSSRCRPNPGSRRRAAGGAQWRQRRMQKGEGVHTRKWRRCGASRHR